MRSGADDYLEVPFEPAHVVAKATRLIERRRAGQELERQLDRVSAQEAELTASLAEHASDYTKLIELGGQLRAVQEQKAGLEERWLTVAEDSS